MGLASFEDKKREELSLIEIARVILEDHDKRMAFADVVNTVQEYLGTSDEEIHERLPQFYTGMNIDGEFISMGDNVWALHLRFPYESVGEEVSHPEDEDNEPRKKHHRKIGAFITGNDDDDIIDYDSDDLENDDSDTEDDDNVDDFDTTNDDDFDDADGDDELSDDIESQLLELDDKDDEDDE